jgi:hypothetical protein
MPGSNLLENTSEISDEAMRAFIAVLPAEEATAPTWCPGWSSHEIVAHVAAAAQERADLIDEHLAGRPVRPTRSWEKREPPFRALPDAQLRQCLVAEAARFEGAVAGMADDDSIDYTGWAMSAERLRTHSHSEASLHRWDLVGDDGVSRRLLAQPRLTSHALAAFAAIPALLEAQRWTDPPFTTGPVRWHSPGQPDVLVEPGSGLSLVSPADRGTVIVMDAHERLLVLWGRCPAPLRSPSRNAETIDDILSRLCD